MARRRNAVRVPAHRGAIVCSVWKLVSGAASVRQPTVDRRIPFSAAPKENQDRARSPAIRQGPPHREPSLRELRGSAAAKCATDTRHLSLVCARNENAPGQDHQSLWRARAGRACKSCTLRRKFVSNSGHPAATLSDALGRLLIAESPGVANRRTPRKNFLVRAATIPPCAERVVVPFFSTPYRVAQ